jgi:hypothetical protein
MSTETIIAILASVIGGFLCSIAFAATRLIKQKYIRLAVNATCTMVIMSILYLTLPGNFWTITCTFYATYLIMLVALAAVSMAVPQLIGKYLSETDEVTLHLRNCNVAVHDHRV